MKQGRLYVNSLLTLATKVTFIVLYSLHIKIYYGNSKSI